ncbi:MAG: phosphatidate cytidylyltransferase [Nitrosomonadales bacterium]|nr:phosphatidate cytidylyltransferase [Nitrosomonadales bacterium]
MLKLRVATAVVLLVLFLLALFALPEFGWVAFVIVVVLQGASEWSRLGKLNSAQAYLFWGVTLAMLLGLAWFDANHTPGQQAMLHLPVYAVSALLWLFVVPTLLITGWKVVGQPWLMALVGWALLIPTGLAMLDLRAINPWILLLVMGLVAAADISAYFAGRRFGKRKLAPSISPGKTWEGVAGAMLGVSIYIVAVWRFSPLSQHEVLPGLLMASWWWVGLAVIGDLFESAIKRQAGVKDSGALLPGHGGLLDRIDALTSTLPLAALVILMQRLS